MGDLIASASNYLHNFAWLRFYGRTDVGDRFNYGVRALTQVVFD